MNRDNYFTSNTDYDADDRPRLYRIGKMINAQTFYELHEGADSRLQKPINQQRVKEIMAYGFYFAAGMFLESVFTFQPYLLPSPREYPKTTVYIHARHPLPQDDGSNIESELTCLHKMFPENFTEQQQISSSPSPCGMVLMSDRQLTLDRLENVSRHLYRCEPILARHLTTTLPGNHTDNEHGVFRGVGFFEDWALARNARSGGVAYQNSHRRVLRTSTSLIQASIEFRRVMEQQSRKEPIPEFPICRSPKVSYGKVQVHV